MSEDDVLAVSCIQPLRDLAATVLEGLGRVGARLGPGWAIGAWTALALMQGMGFVANAVQTTSSLHGLVLLMSVVPASLGVLSTVIVLFYPLNEAKMSQIASDLRNRRALEVAGNTMDGTLPLVV